MPMFPPVGIGEYAPRIDPMSARRGGDQKKAFGAASLAQMSFPRIFRPCFFALSLGLGALAASTVNAVPASADVTPVGTVITAAGSVLKTAGSAVAAQSSAHIMFTAVSSSSGLNEKIVADVGKKSGSEELSEGAAELSVRVTPKAGYVRGTSTGLTSLFGMSAAQAKTVGSKWETWKPGTSEYTNLKSVVTVASLTSLLPKAKGITVKTAASNGDKRYILAWTTAATGSTPKLSNTLSVSASKANLPIEETSTDADGVKVTTKVSKWGEPVVVRDPSPGSTIDSSKVTG